jgi:uncharacterized membrane protein YqaE (UPF0057 family)
MIELNVVGQEVFMWLQIVAGYVVTLPIPALLALVLPFLAAFLARSVCAFVIAILLAVAALSIPHAGPAERYQYSTLALLVLIGLIAAFLGALRYRDRARVRALLTAGEEARMEISELEEQLQRERLFNYGQGSEGLNLRP